MLGYIYKDLKMLFWLVTIIVLYVVGIIAISSLDQNISDSSNTGFYFILFIPFVLMIAVPMESYKQDCHSGFIKYSSSLPGGMRTYIHSKYICSLGLGLLALAFSGIVLLFLRFICDIRITPYYLIGLFSFMLLLISILLAVMFLFGSENTDVIFITFFVLLVLVIITYALFGDISFFIDGGNSKIINWIHDNKFQIKIMVSLSCPLNLGALKISNLYTIANKRYLKGR